MTTAELLEAYAAGPDRLERAVAGLSPEALVRRPAYEGAWTIKEHLVHLADSEANNFIRIKSIVAQPNSDCYVMEEEAWTANIARKDEDAGKYLRLFRLLREIIVEFVAEELDANGDRFFRTYKGERSGLTMRDDLEIYARHVDFHLEFIERIKGSLA